MPSSVPSLYHFNPMHLHIFLIFFWKMRVHNKAIHIGQIDHLKRCVLVHFAGIGDDVALSGCGDHCLVAVDLFIVGMSDSLAQIDGGDSAETFVDGEGADKIRRFDSDDGAGFGPDWPAGDIDVHAVQQNRLGSDMYI